MKAVLKQQYQLPYSKIRVEGQHSLQLIGPNIIYPILNDGHLQMVLYQRLTDWRVQRESKTGLSAEKRGTNKPTWGRRLEEYSKKTPNLAKKNEIEGHF